MRYAALVCAALAVPTTARAQQAPDAAAPLACADAERGHLAEAVGDVARREYARAATALEPMVSRCPMPGAMYALAGAWRAMGRVLDAIAMYERYLGVDEGADRGYVRGEIDAMRRTLVALHLRATPSDAAVTLDGRALSLRELPPWLDPVAHVLELRAPGYVTWRRELPAQTGGAHTLEVVLAAADTTGRLSLRASHPDALLSVNGEPVGRGSFERDLAPGRYLLEARAPGFDPWRSSVTLARGSQHRVEATLAAPGRVETRASWLVPTLVAGGVALAVGITLTTLWLTRGTEEPVGDPTRLTPVPSR